MFNNPVMAWNRVAVRGYRHLQSNSDAVTVTSQLQPRHRSGMNMKVRNLCRSSLGAKRHWSAQPLVGRVGFKPCTENNGLNSIRWMSSNVNPSESNEEKAAQNSLTSGKNEDITTPIQAGDPAVFFEMSKSFSRSDPWRSKLVSTMLVYPNFITEKEEESLMKEIEPYISRLHYETAHWDAAIHDYRETERSKWNKQNDKIINRIRGLAFPVGVPQLKLVHILDLAKMGVIKPHIDSIRFCGNTIAGLSLLSDCVMRLCHDVQKDFFCDVLLPRRSLYVMSDFSRYEFTHEILADSDSLFKNQKVSRDRRVSIICRNEPENTPGPVFKPLISTST